MTGKIKCQPKGEMAVREWIAAHLEELGFDIIRSGGAFPDLLLANVDGTEILTEVEHICVSFITHRHDPSGCDLVICWEHNSILPVPVIELATGKRYAENEKSEQVEILYRFDDSKPTRSEILAALSSIPDKMKDFMLLMAEDLKIRSKWSQALCATRLPLSKIIVEINQHLVDAGIVNAVFTPDGLLKLIGK